MSNDQIELDYYDCLLRKSDVDLLEEPCWINDNLIAFAFEYFEREPFKALVKDVAFIGPHVVQCVKFMSEDDIQAMLQHHDLHNKLFVVFPINDNSVADRIGGSHWSLVVFSKADKTCYHYDSMNQGNYNSAQKIWNKLKLYFQEEMALVAADTPQQTNSCDCGVYVICLVEYVCRQLLSQQASKSSTNGQSISALNVDLIKDITPHLVRNKRADLKRLIKSLRTVQSTS